MMLHPSIFLILATFTATQPVEPFTFEHEGFTCVCWPTDLEPETFPPAPDEPELYLDWPAPYEGELADEYLPCPPSAP
jgi:hypothetical protein